MLVPARSGSLRHPSVLVLQLLRAVGERRRRGLSRPPESLGLVGNESRLDVARARTDITPIS